MTQKVVNHAQPRFFPHASSADHNGLVAIDPRIDTQRMLDAYQNGIFPWPCLWDGQWFVGWYSLDPRAILPLDDLRIPSRLQRKLRTGHFRFRWNSCFDSIIDHCSSVGNRKSQTWLTAELVAEFKQLHRAGVAHSIEVFGRDGELCGGLYGIAVGGSFSAESMFHFQSDASKAAVCALVAMLRRCGFKLLDIQQTSAHLAALGAVEVDRSDYLISLQHAVELRPRWPKAPEQPVWLEQFDYSNYPTGEV